MRNRSRAGWGVWWLLLGTLCAGLAPGTDLTIGPGGRVAVELIGSEAAFRNTMSVTSPAVAVALTGCKLEPAGGLTGVHLVSEKLSQRGCRVELDADPGTAGIQAFAAGTTFRFGFCAQTDADDACEFVWSSNAASNSDGDDHLQTTDINPGSPGRVFRLNWEDKPDLGDMDFNDLIAVVRVIQDTDGDGLWDDWETSGIDSDGDGVIDLDLPNLLAVDLNGDGDTLDPGERVSPNHKDIFIEIDWMDCAVAGGDCAAGDTHNHRPKDAAINAAVQMFRNANVNNPDGTTGITLRVDRSNSFAHQNAHNIPGLCFSGGAGIGNFDTVKAAPANFGPNNPRRFAFRYSQWTHRQVTTSTSSGCGELPGNDFQVSLGGWNAGQGDVDGDGLADADVGTVAQQVGTLVHELGHTLNLGHGGGDGANFKPNYLSAMSYWFQIPGIPPTDPDGAAGPLQGRIDYSRSALGNLTESALSEPAGIGDGTDNTFYFCPNATSATGAGTGGIDWNCDTDTTDLGVVNDINGDRGCVGPGANNVLATGAAGDDFIQNNMIVDGPNLTCNSTAVMPDDQQLKAVGAAQTNPLTGFNDWANLKYDFQNSGAYEDGDHTSVMQVIELDHPTYLQMLAPELAMAKAGSPGVVVTGSNITYTLGVINNTPSAASNTTVTDNLPATTTFVSCASGGGGVCGGSGNSRTVSFAQFPGGGSASMTLVATANCEVPNGTVIGNTASVAFSSFPPDPIAGNNSASASVTASNPPPVISNAAPGTTQLWPPNHQMVDVTIGYVVTDNCGTPVCSLAVTSNEPVNGLGDGDAFPDWEVVGPKLVRLRAERGGGGTGRTYTVGITCTDSGGGSSGQSVAVQVPINQR